MIAMSLYRLFLALLIVALLLIPAQVGQATPLPSASGPVSDALTGALDRLREASNVAPFQTTRIYDRHGTLLYEISDRGRRTVIALDQAPQALINATIATEDKNFYTHSGVDYAAIGRAAWQNWRSGEIVSGASTITQQLARTLLLDESERYELTLRRKMQEASLSWDLEERYSKDEILELYFNAVYYGHQAYGIAAAAETFFSKDVSELTLAESALLVGLPQSPVQWDPFVNPEAAKDRQATVLALMAREGYITPEEKEAALREPLRFVTPEPPTLQAPHFVNYVRELLLERYGPEGLRQGLQVYTSLDLRYQQTAEEIARAQVAQIGPAHNASNAAVVILHPPTGQVLAMVGSVDYYNEGIAGQINMTARRRQPGSAIKPVLYASALENGWTPASVLWDAPARYRNANNWYTPRNTTGRFYGGVRLRMALANSLNVSAIRLLYLLGMEKMLDTAQRLGIQSWREPASAYGLSLAVGGYEVTLLELTHAFSTLANNGVQLPVQPIALITDQAGRAIFRAELPSPPIQAVSAATAYQISSILSDARSRQLIFGATSALNTSQPTAVKTGTTDDWRDNLTVGYTPYVAVGVWMGNSDGKPMKNIFGFRSTGPIWHDIMEAIWAAPDLHPTLGDFADGALPHGFVQPPGMYVAPVCDLSLATFSRYCPVAYEEAFVLPDAPLTTASASNPGELVDAGTPRENPRGYCLPALQNDIPEELLADILMVSYPKLAEDQAAANRWGLTYGLNLRTLDQCHLVPIQRKVVQQPPLPAPQRLVFIPEAEPEGDDVVAGRRVVISHTIHALNVRSQPGVDHRVLGALRPNQIAIIRDGPVNVGGSQWYQVQVFDAALAGWVNGAYLVSIPSEDAGAAAEPGAPDGYAVGTLLRSRPDLRYWLNMRAGPGTTYDVVGYVRPEDVLRVTEGPRMVGEVPWYAVRNVNRGTDGWVHGGLLRPTPVE